MTEHKTPLSYHFKHAHIWFDMAVLVALFIVAAYYPWLKIVPLVASLELFSFFSFHLLAKRSRFQLQGFLGGLISSTAVFLQVLNDDKFSSTGQRELLLTLLFAICAMLLECVFIIYFLSEQLSLVYYLPFISQLFFFSIVIIYVSRSASSRFASTVIADTAIDIELLYDHPIVWKNVAKLSLLIFALIYTMQLIGNEFGLSQSISTLLVSLFEAHAILASVMTAWSVPSQNTDLITLFFLILLGNTLSKSYFALAGKNLQQKRFFVAVMFGSLVVSIGVTVSWFYLTSSY